MEQTTFGGNGDASVMYSTVDENGKKNTVFRIGNKDVDLNDAKSIEEAKEYLEGLKTGMGSTVFRLFGFDPTAVLNSGIKYLDEHLKALPEKSDIEQISEDNDSDYHYGATVDEDHVDFDWESLGIDWEKESHCIADLYLSENFAGYDDQEPEKQASQIKALASFYEWLNKTRK